LITGAHKDELSVIGAVVHGKFAGRNVDCCMVVLMGWVILEAVNVSRGSRDSISGDVRVGLLMDGVQCICF